MKDYKLYLIEDIISAQQAIELYGGISKVKGDALNPIEAANNIINWLLQLRTIQCPTQINKDELLALLANYYMGMNIQPIVPKSDIELWDKETKYPHF